jgi:hypothetical protein
MISVNEIRRTVSVVLKLSKGEYIPLSKFVTDVCKGLGEEMTSYMFQTIRNYLMVDHVDGGFVYYNKGQYPGVRSSLYR